MGVTTSNSAEQMNNAAQAARGRPICSLVATLVGHIADERFKRHRAAVQRGEPLTPWCTKRMNDDVTESCKLVCMPEEASTRQPSLPGGQRAHQGGLPRHRTRRLQGGVRVPGL